MEQKEKLEKLEYFKIIAHIANFPSSGYYLVCLRSGESIDKRYGSPSEAALDAINPSLRLCKCRRCAGFYLEEDFGLAKK